jgi:cytoskeletal protein CcmA (bactofilin family)
MDQLHDMNQLHDMEQQQRRFLYLTGIVLGTLMVAGLFTLGYTVVRAHSEAPLAPQLRPAAPPLTVAAESTIVYEDLVVDSGAIYDGDVIVYSGDVDVRAGSQIHGSLVVYSGDIDMEAGAIINGDMIGLSGDADIGGRVGGDVVIWSGDIALAESAVVGGDVSVMTGNIDRAAGASVQGNVIIGPKFPKLPPILQELGGVKLPGQSTVVEATPLPREQSEWNPAVRTLLRLILATFVTAFIVLITSLVYYFQPALIHRLRVAVTTQKPTSFVIGLLLNIVLTLLMMLTFSSSSVFMALCLAPLSLLAVIFFLLLNTGGWAALSLVVGERILSYTNITSNPLTALLVGATAMTGAIAFVWALGSCMRPVAYLVMLTLTALGGGSLIVSYLRPSQSDQPTTV